MKAPSILLSIPGSVTWSILSFCLNSTVGILPVKPYAEFRFIPSSLIISVFPCVLSEMGPMLAVPWDWEFPVPPEPGTDGCEGAGEGAGEGTVPGEGWPDRLPFSLTDRYFPSDEGVMV